MTEYTTITSDNITSAIRNNFRALLEDFEDPTSAKNRKMIYEREPHVKAAGFDGYPIIVISNYSATDVSDTVNDFHTVWEGIFTVRIQADEDNPEHLDQLSDRLYQIKGRSDQINLGNQGVFNVEISSGDREIGINEKENFIFERRVDISFNVKVDMG